MADINETPGYPASEEYLKYEQTDKLITKDELYVGRILRLQEDILNLENLVTRKTLEGHRDKYQFFILFMSIFALFGSFLGIVLASGFLKLDAAPIAMAKDVLLLSAGIISATASSYFKRDN